MPGHTGQWDAAHAGRGVLALDDVMSYSAVKSTSGSAFPSTKLPVMRWPQRSDGCPGCAAHDRDGAGHVDVDDADACVCGSSRHGHAVVDFGTVRLRGRAVQQPARACLPLRCGSARVACTPVRSGRMLSSQQCTSRTMSSGVSAGTAITLIGGWTG